MSITAQQRKEIAALVGMNEQYLYQCLSRRRDMRPAEAVRVERVSKGLIARQDLRRDWRDVWPATKVPKSKAKA